MVSVRREFVLVEPRATYSCMVASREPPPLGEREQWDVVVQSPPHPDARVRIHLHPGADEVLDAGPAQGRTVEAMEAARAELSTVLPRVRAGLLPTYRVAVKTDAAEPTEPRGPDYPWCEAAMNEALRLSERQPFLYEVWESDLNRGWVPVGGARGGKKLPAANYVRLF
jgi:hypothetical protein